MEREGVSMEREGNCKKAVWLKVVLVVWTGGKKGN